MSSQNSRTVLYMSVSCLFNILVPETYIYSVRERVFFVSLGWFFISLRWPGKCCTPCAMVHDKRHAILGLLNQMLQRLKGHGSLDLWVLWGHWISSVVDKDTKQIRPSCLWLCMFQRAWFSLDLWVLWGNWISGVVDKDTKQIRTLCLWLRMFQTAWFSLDLWALWGNWIECLVQQMKT